MVVRLRQIWLIASALTMQHAGALNSIWWQRRFEMKVKLILAISLMVLLCPILGSAQIVTVEKTRIHVPFQFMVEGKAFPAGEYEFAQGSDGQYVSIKPVGKGPSADVLIVTRLAADLQTTSKDSHVVFDVVGNTYILSELWIANVDGYLLHATKEQHKHRIVNRPA
jgi:hypothetical protein